MKHNKVDSSASPGGSCARYQCQATERFRSRRKSGRPRAQTSGKRPRLKLHRYGRVLKNLHDVPDRGRIAKEVDLEANFGSVDLGESSRVRSGEVLYTVVW